MFVDREVLAAFPFRSFHTPLPYCHVPSFSLPSNSSHTTPLQHLVDRARTRSRHHIDVPSLGYSVNVSAVDGVSERPE